MNTQKEDIFVHRKQNSKGFTYMRYKESYEQRWSKQEDEFRKTEMAQCNMIDFNQ